MQGDNMKDGDIDKLLRQHLSGDQPQETLKQEILRDSLANFGRVQRRRSAWRRVEHAAAAVLIAGIAFLGGRLSAPPALLGTVDTEPQAAARSDGVAVPSDLIAWLDAARLFGQLGMQDRMARAVVRASKLLPVDAITTDDRTGQAFAAGGSVENQKECMEPVGVSAPQPLVESTNQILAQSFGD